MREIKFKAWDGLDMMTAYGIHNDNIIMDFGGQLITASTEHGIILLQYSGLKDKNNKEIYEGDIIRFISFDKEYTLECPNLSHFHFWQETKDNKTAEVIGNIYENPELLK